MFLQRTLTRGVLTKNFAPQRGFVPSRTFASEKGLQGTKTHQNLKEAFSGESQANRRYLFFAAEAEKEGKPEAAEVFRQTAEGTQTYSNITGETGHAHGHLFHLASVGDPATDLPIGSTIEYLKSAVAGETYLCLNNQEYTDMYPGFAKVARDEGFDEIADWFETLAMAEKSHANRFQSVLKEMEGQ